MELLLNQCRLKICVIPKQSNMHALIIYAIAMCKFTKCILFDQQKREKKYGNPNRNSDAQIPGNDDFQAKAGFDDIYFH